MNKGQYNVYKITTKPEWCKRPIYCAGISPLAIFVGTNDDYHKAITNIELVESGLSLKSIKTHKIGMSYIPADWEIQCCYTPTIISNNHD